jgi:hypothetical protein
MPGRGSPIELTDVIALRINGDAAGRMQWVLVSGF